MTDIKKRNVLGIDVSVTDYSQAVAAIIEAAQARKPLKVTALAVHGVMTGALDPEQRWRLNSFDIVTPDGQPVRWALNLLYGTGLRDRVRGPDLTLKICEEAARRKLPVYLYGSRPEVLEKLHKRLVEKFPGLRIAGMRPSLFRNATAQEKRRIAREIRDSGARIVLVGLGCPRQEVWVYEYTGHISMPALAVGAAFDFHAGLQSVAPAFMQEHGLEWFYRLMQEPRRLWRRYVLLNPAFLAMLFAQLLKLTAFDQRGTKPSRTENYA